MSHFKAAIAKGIALLDEKGPADWRTRVTKPLSGQDFFTMDKCVLGQAMGNYSPAMEELGLGSPFTNPQWTAEDSPAVAHGFAPGDSNVHLLAAEWNTALGLVKS